MDEEFIKIMLQIEECYQMMNKHYKIRVEAWTKKLCQVTTNEVWKKNRNLYARILLNQVHKSNLSEPFDKRPPEGPLPKLNKYLVLNDQKENSKPILKSLQNHNYSLDTGFNKIMPQQQQQQEQEQQQTQDDLNLGINEKLFRLLIDCRQYLEKRNDSEANMLKQQQDEFFQWMQEQQAPNYVLDQIDEKTEENEEQQKDTMQFLQYLDSFEKKTERLKLETEKYLKNNNY